MPNPSPSGVGSGNQRQANGAWIANFNLGPFVIATVTEILPAVPGFSYVFRRLTAAPIAGSPVALLLRDAGSIIYGAFEIGANYPHYDFDPQGIAYGAPSSPIYADIYTPFIGLNMSVTYILEAQ